MKKIGFLGLVLGAFFFTSCKKDFTCKCFHNENTYTYPISDMKKKDAKKKCYRVGIQWINLGGYCDIDKVEKK